MARKFELHLDALIVIVLLFVAAVGFVVYQRHQYSILAQENLGRQMTQLSLELEVARLEEQLRRATRAEQGASSALKDRERPSRP
jgi:cell division protein FtsL